MNCIYFSAFDIASSFKTAVLNDAPRKNNRNKNDSNSHNGSFLS